MNYEQPNEFCYQTGAPPATQASRTVCPAHATRFAARTTPASRPAAASSATWAPTATGGSRLVTLGIDVSGVGNRVTVIVFFSITITIMIT